MKRFQLKAILAVTAVVAIANTNVDRLFQRDQPRSTFSSGVRISQSAVQVTGVQLNATASGLEVILETPDGQVLQAVTTRIQGKSAIADLENAARFRWSLSDESS